MNVLINSNTWTQNQTSGILTIQSMKDMVSVRIARYFLTLEQNCETGASCFSLDTTNLGHALAFVLGGG